MKKLICKILLLLSAISISAQQTPAPKQTAPFSIEGATAHLGNGEIIENSLIMIADGKISWIGSANTKIARMGKVINAKGKHAYPGFIAVNSSLGLVEIDAVKASDDEDEVGALLPHIRSLISYNAESKVVESMRPNGVLMAQIVPRGGTVSGTSSVMQLDAWNWEDAVIKKDNAIHINWPGSLTRGRWWLGEDPALKADPKYSENTENIKNYFSEAKLYLESTSPEIHLPFKAMKGLFDGTQKLFIHVSGAKEITDAVTIAKESGINKIVIVHGNEADKIADLLVKNNIPVVIDRAHRVPDLEDDAYDLPFRTAKILMDKGIIVTIGMEGQMERMNTRNIPFYAGTYASFGIPKEEALKMITSNAAKTLGIDDFVGTLAVGKDATLFISEGDALDMRTNILSKAYIQGRDISLETHQTKLWRRYSDKLKTD